MNHTPEDRKPCIKCGVTRSLTEYHRSSVTKDGRRNSCKPCVSAYVRKRTQRLADAYVAPTVEDTKVCIKCGEDKSFSEYSRKSSSKDGHRNDCKACVSAYMKSRQEAHGEDINARRRDRYRANPEKSLAECRAWRAANLEWSKAYHKAHHKKRWASDAKYRAQHAAAYTRYFRLLSSAKSEPYTREGIFDRDSWRCGICGGVIDSALRWPNVWSASIDHIVPLSLGGDDTPANVQAAHVGCNQGKGNRVDVDEMQVS